jgi:hypothetical protein
MRSLSVFGLVVSVSCLCSSTLGASDQVATATIGARANFETRTSLQVSTRVLEFHVTNPEVAAEATLDYIAGVRVQPGAETILQVQTSLPAGGAGIVLTVGTEGVSADSVAIDGAAPVTAARWDGAGLRTGTLRFSLRGAPGTYRVPINLALNAS